MTDFLSAFAAGVTQVLIGHPFDTIKVLIQNKKSIKNLKLKNYYRGSKYPLISSTIINSILFPIYERTQNFTNSSFKSGFLGGMIITPIIFGFDYGKINNQTNYNKKIIINDILKSKGKFSVLTRECIAFSIYFGVYDFLKNEKKIHPLISGGLAGLANWTSTYPIDVIKSRQIAQQISIIDAYKQKNLWKGFPICALRAVIVNAGIFYTYDSIKYILSQI